MPQFFHKIIQRFDSAAKRGWAISVAIWLCFYAGGCLTPNPTYTTRPPRETAPSRSEIRKQLEPKIESYMGVPYMWGGTSRNGMDCSGFVITVYEEAIGLELPRKARAMYDKGDYVKRSELRYGDLVFFERVTNYGVSHVGIYVGRNSFAHASTTEGVVISDLDDSYYKQRYVGARRVYE